jgi:predicted acylesterase/phospholipase RssA
VGAFSFAADVFNRSQKQRADIHDALAVLASGSLEGEIEPVAGAGELRCRLVAAVDASERRVGVVTIVVEGLHLSITAYEWAQR